MDPSPPPTRRRRLTIGRLMLAVALLAVALKVYTTIGPGAGNALAALGLAVLAARAIAANPPGAPARRRAISWTRACLAAYLPCSVGFFMDCSHCVGVWRQLWPLVPGAIPGFSVSRLVARDGRWELLEFSLSAGFTLALIALMAGLGLRGKRWMVVSLAAGAFYSTFAALAVSSAIRS